MATVLKISGNYIRIYDDGTGEEYIRNILNETTFSRDENDNFQFLYKAPNIADTTKLYVLGGEYTIYAWDDLIDFRTGLAFVSADALDDYLSRRLGFFLNFRYESDVIYTNAIVAPLVAIKLLDANEDRLAFTVSNDGTQDVVVRFKAAATDNNVEGVTVKAGSQKEFRDIEYKGEVSAIRLTTTGGATSSVNSMEW